MTKVKPPRPTSGVPECSERKYSFMLDNENQGKKMDKRPEDASDDQLGQVSGGHRWRDDGGEWREGYWEGHHYHHGYRGRWEGGVWINL